MGTQFQRKPDPTPLQIRNRAAAIRDGWNKGQERMRRGLAKVAEPYTIPKYVVIPPRHKKDGLSFDPQE